MLHWSGSGSIALLSRKCLEVVWKCPPAMQEPQLPDPKKYTAQQEYLTSWPSGNSQDTRPCAYVTRFWCRYRQETLESLCGEDRIDRIWLRWSEKILLSGILVWRRPGRPNMASLVRENPPLWNPCVKTTGSTEYGFAGQRKSSFLESLCGEDRIDRIWLRWSERIYQYKYYQQYFLWY